MIRLTGILLSLWLAVQPAVSFAQSSDDAIIRYNAIHHPYYDSRGMVASQVALASEIGADILAQGGNAVDASIAVGFALAVTLPRAGNIGGGGFMLAYIAEEQRTIAIDYREMAPPGAHRDMFIDADGNADPQVSRFSHLASGVPGTVAGFWLAHSRYGKLPWKDLVMPAVDLARDGIIVSYDLAKNLADKRERLSRTSTTRAYFFKDGGQPYEPGDLLVQSDLADSLQLIADDGPGAFYKGSIARKIADEMARHGGLIDMQAMALYKPALREPVTGSYRGYDIVSMPPSSSGGIHVIQMLNILEHFPVAELGSESAANVHLLAEAARTAYADRSEHLGDIDFYDVPVDWLTSKQYAKELAAQIDLQSARSSSDVRPGVAPVAESVDTTHWSVMDIEGNTIANTYTLNFSYGSGVSVPGAGFLMNNEMDDFVSKPGVPNAFGMLGGEANAVRAHKRPLSSMTPTLVFKDGEPYLATGSPGGSRIITAVLQILVNVIDHGMNIADATSAPRMHHQWFPDVLELESGFSIDTIRELERRGHRVERKPAATSLQTVSRDGSIFLGASDSRRPAARPVGAEKLPQ